MIKFIGSISRDEVNELYSKSRAGIVIFMPVPNHMEAMPNKLFEYMAAGLPVICSDFPLWKKIIEVNNCGICVNPRSIREVRNACNMILDSPWRCCQMGMNGRRAVIRKYNWEREESKLFKLYEGLLKA